MEVPAAVVSASLVAVVSALLVVTGVRKQPGLGVLGALVLILATLALRGGVAAIGFAAPASWRRWCSAAPCSYVWLVLFTHGFVDTVGIGLVAAGYDQRVCRP